jgi:guanine deaminase
MTCEAPQPDEETAPDPLRRAIEWAVRSVELGGGPFGAVVVHAGQVVGEGHNRVTLDCDPTAHAEVVALRAAAATLGRFDLAGCVLYSSCEPCPMCLGAAHWSRVERVVFAADRHDAAAAGFDDAALYEELQRELPERRLPLEQRLADVGRTPFEAWARHAGRIAY